MDPAKSASEFGSKLQSGEEPVSGKEGKGTAEQPYDQGNAEGGSFCSATPHCCNLKKLLLGAGLLIAPAS